MRRSDPRPHKNSVAYARVARTLLSASCRKKQQPMTRNFAAASRPTPQLTAEAPPPKIATERWPQAYLFHNGVDKRRGTGPEYPWLASYRRSKAAALPQSNRAQASSANAETNPLPCLRERPAETPVPWPRAVS